MSTNLLIHQKVHLLKMIISVIKEWETENDKKKANELVIKVKDLGKQYFEKGFLEHMSNDTDWNFMSIMKDFADEFLDYHLNYCSWTIKDLRECENSEDIPPKCVKIWKEIHSHYQKI